MLTIPVGSLTADRVAKIGSEMEELIKLYKAGDMDAFETASRASSVAASSVVHRGAYPNRPDQQVNRMRRNANHPNTKRLKGIEDVLKRYREGVERNNHELLSDAKRVFLWEFVRQLTNELAVVQREYEAEMTARDVRRGKIELGMIEDCVICGQQCRTRCPNKVKSVMRVDGLPFATGTDASRAVLVEEEMDCGFSCHRHPSCALLTKAIQGCRAIVRDQGVEALPAHFRALWEQGAAGQAKIKNESWVCKMCVGYVQVAAGEQDDTFPVTNMPLTEADNRPIVAYRGRVGPWNGSQEKEHSVDEVTNKIVYAIGDRYYPKVGEYFGRSEGLPAPIRPTDDYKQAQTLRSNRLLELEKQGTVQLDQELEREIAEHGVQRARATGAAQPVAGVATNPTVPAANTTADATYPCRLWPTFGGCPKGTDCPYAHDRDLLPVTAICLNCGCWARHTTLYCPRPGGQGITAQSVEQIMTGTLQAQQAPAPAAGA